MSDENTNSFKIECAFEFNASFDEDGQLAHFVLSDANSGEITLGNLSDVDRLLTALDQIRRVWVRLQEAS